MCEVGEATGSGHWALGTGYWVLGTGHWARATSTKSRGGAVSSPLTRPLRVHPLPPCGRGGCFTSPLWHFSTFPLCHFDISFPAAVPLRSSLIAHRFRLLIIDFRVAEVLDQFALVGLGVLGELQDRGLAGAEFATWPVLRA
jgi:hypothetical protein